MHEGSGLPHAEVNAINSIRGGEDQLRGATFYVSLEPCAFEEDPVMRENSSQASY